MRVAVVVLLEHVDRLLGLGDVLLPRVAKPGLLGIMQIVKTKYLFCILCIQLNVAMKVKVIAA